MSWRWSPPDAAPVFPEPSLWATPSQPRLRAQGSPEWPRPINSITCVAFVLMSEGKHCAGRNAVGSWVTYRPGAAPGSPGPTVYEGPCPTSSGLDPVLACVSDSAVPQEVRTRPPQAFGFGPPTLGGASVSSSVIRGSDPIPPTVHGRMQWGWSSSPPLDGHWPSAVRQLESGRARWAPDTRRLLTHLQSPGGGNSSRRFKILSRWHMLVGGGVRGGWRRSNTLSSFIQIPLRCLHCAFLTQLGGCTPLTAKALPVSFPAIRSPQM